MLLYYDSKRSMCNFTFDNFVLIVKSNDSDTLYHGPK